VVADHTKWGIVGLSSFAALGEVDTLITDSQLHPEARDLITEQVEELILADGSSEGQAVSAARPAADGG
jgi:DeoR/GlpR family transcriptional regulator of sugar metabolism